ncbi:MAG: hypothetical protein M1497_00355 [Nitrospirae bacterium]|nr:hypothetical protein [Nitrospirota bacterium]
MKTSARRGAGGLRVLRWLPVPAMAALAVIAACSVASAEWNWPREVIGDEGRLTIYQPQLELFRADKVNARAALSVQRKKEKEPVFGVFWFSARVVTDRDSRVVSFGDVKVGDIKFSKAAGEEDREAARSLISRATALSSMSMSLDRFVSMTSAVEREKTVSDNIKNDPPRILFATTPTVLILINGKPILREVAGTGVRRVVNTPFVMLYEPSSKVYYLKGADLWYRASDVTGPWSSPASPPAAVKSAARQIAEPDDPALTQSLRTKAKVAPGIIVATEPTELIVSDGEPQYSVVPGTDLLYVSNTTSDLFMDVRSREHYVLLAGRWFRSPALNDGPWTYVPSQKLPAAFYQIPAGSEKGHVLTFIADTRQAEEAVAEAQIPQTAAISRNSARIDVTYDGTPRFERIGGTDIDYAVNTSSQVLRIRGKYYACQQAVWFVSDSPEGPWVVSDYRPEEIDAIPPESPVYNVKYVYVYDSTPDTVYVGYTPGYVGTYVCGGTILYGTGYLYPGWAGDVYYPAPVTWGFSPWYYPYYGTWGFGAGFVSGTFFGFTVGVIGSPWWGWGGWWGSWWGPWGGWWGWGGSWHHGSYAFDRHGPRHHDHPGNIYNRPGNRAWSARPARDSRTAVASGAARTSGAGRSWGSGRQSAAGARSEGFRQNRAGRYQQGVGGPAESRSVRRSGSTRQRVYGGTGSSGWSRRNNVYASRDGGVYRRTEKGWMQRDRGGWARPEAVDRSGFYRNRQGLERDYYVRSRGYERESSFRSHGTFQRGSSRSGAYRSGGSGGRSAWGAGRSGGSFRGAAPGRGSSRGGAPAGQRGGRR